MPREIRIGPPRAGQRVQRDGQRRPGSSAGDRAGSSSAMPPEQLAVAVGAVVGLGFEAVQDEAHDSVVSAQRCAGSPRCAPCSSSCVPWSTSSPRRSTRMRSAQRIWLSRWVIRKVVRSLADAAHGALDLVLGGAVDGAGAVVQDQDARVGEEGAGDGDALPLPAGQGHAALADLGLVAVVEAGDELVRLRLARRLLDRPPASRRRSQRRCSRRACARRGRRPARWSRSASAATPGSSRARPRRRPAPARCRRRRCG